MPNLSELYLCQRKINALGKHPTVDLSEQQSNNNQASSNAYLSDKNKASWQANPPYPAALEQAFRHGIAAKQQPAAAALQQTRNPFATSPTPLQQVRQQAFFQAVQRCCQPIYWQEYAYFALNAGQGAIKSIQYSFYPYFHQPWARYGLVVTDLIFRNYVCIVQLSQQVYYQKQDLKLQQCYTKQLAGCTQLAGLANEQNKITSILQQVSLLHKQHTSLWAQLCVSSGNLLITLVRMGLHWQAAIAIMLPLQCCSFALQFLIKLRFVQPIQRNMASLEIEQNNNLQLYPSLLAQGTLVDFRQWLTQDNNLRQQMSRLIVSQQASQILSTCLQVMVNIAHWYAMGWLTPTEMTNQAHSQAMSLSLASSQIMDTMMLLPNFWQERKHVLLQLEARATQLETLHSCTFTDHIQIDALTLRYNNKPITYQQLLELIAKHQCGLVTLQAPNGSGKSMLLSNLQQAYGQESILLPASAQFVTGANPGSANSTGQRVAKRLKEVMHQLKQASSITNVRLLLLDEIRANLSAKPRQWLDEQITILSKSYLVMEIYHQPEQQAESSAQSS